MSSYPRSQRTHEGNQNEFRVRGEPGNWWVEGTDNNRVWVDSEPGYRYKTKVCARDAAKNLADVRKGKLLP